MAKDNKGIESTEISDERIMKIEHNEEVREKMKNGGTGLIGDKFVDDHYVPRCY